MNKILNFESFFISMMNHDLQHHFLTDQKYLPQVNRL